MALFFTEASLITREPLSDQENPVSWKACWRKIRSKQLVNHRWHSDEKSVRFSSTLLRLIVRRTCVRCFHHSVGFLANIHVLRAGNRTRQISTFSCHRKINDHGNIRTRIRDGCERNYSRSRTSFDRSVKLFLFFCQTTNAVSIVPYRYVNLLGINGSSFFLEIYIGCRGFSPKEPRLNQPRCWGTLSSRRRIFL